MTTTARPRRLSSSIAAAAVVAGAMALAACGADPASGGPPVIRLADTSGEARAVGDTVGAAGDGVEMLIAGPVEYEFVLADSARTEAERAPAWRLDPPADLRAEAERLGEHLGLDAAGLSSDDHGNVQFGGREGSEPMLRVARGGDWFYLGTSEQEAPTGVPSAAEAESLARELFEAVGGPGRLVDVHSEATDWSAGVHASVEIGGRPSPLSVHATFGDAGELTSAGGTLVEAVEVGDYPTVDAGTAVERLAERPFLGLRLGLGEAGVPARPLEPTLAPDSPVSSGPATGESRAVPDPETRPTEPMPVPDPPDPEGPTEPMPVPDPETRPTEPMPVPDPPDPEDPQVVTVTLVDVETSLGWISDVDEVAWLLPSYLFTDDEGRPWRVLAIADGYLEFQEDPPIDLAPLPEVEADPAEPRPDRVPPDVPPSGAAPDDLEPSADYEDLADAVVGLGEQDATARLEAAGATVRVVSRDGEQYMVTQDYRPDRVNLEIEDGVVAGAAVG